VAGTTKDANGPALASLLAQRGVGVLRQELVGDDVNDIRECVERAAQQAALVVVTGGLGPTDDDVTSFAVARAAAVDLKIDEAELKKLKQRFRDFGMEMPASNAKQAEFPDGAAVLPNNQGTAPGFIIEIGMAQVTVLPGPPWECTAMFEQEALPRLEALLQLGPAIETRVLRTFGLTESGLADIIEKDPYEGSAIIGYKAAFPEILLVLRASGEDATEQLDRCRAHLESLLAYRIYGKGDARLPEVVLDMLIQRKMTLAVAESCTGGLISKLLTDIPGSSGVLERGVVTYSNESKTDLLGIPVGMLDQYGAVSEPVALEMAKSIRERSGADFGIGVTGIAGPSGGTEEKPVGTVWLSLATAEGVNAWRYRFRWDRHRVRMLSAWAALERLRRFLLGVQREDQWP